MCDAPDTDRLDEIACTVWDSIFKYGPGSERAIARRLDLPTSKIRNALLRHADWFWINESQISIAYTEPTNGRPS